MMYFSAQMPSDNGKFPSGWGHTKLGGGVNDSVVDSVGIDGSRVEATEKMNRVNLIKFN